MTVLPCDVGQYTDPETGLSPDINRRSGGRSSRQLDAVEKQTTEPLVGTNMTTTIERREGQSFCRRHSVGRYYDPATGQMLSRDPLIGLTRQPYAYVGDNPINNVDPTGLYYAPNGQYTCGPFSSGEVGPETPCPMGPYTPQESCALGLPGGACPMGPYTPQEACDLSQLNPAQPAGEPTSFGDGSTFETVPPGSPPPMNPEGPPNFSIHPAAVVHAVARTGADAGGCLAVGGAGAYGGGFVGSFFGPIGTTVGVVGGFIGGCAAGVFGVENNDPLIP